MDHFYILITIIKNMLTEESIKILRYEWNERISATSGIIYRYVQKDLIESFIKDLEKFKN